MVDPATQLDQGGNPLQEGVWAGVDGGWQPAYRRDEFFAKTASAPVPPPSGIEPQHHGTAQPGIPGGLHWRNLHLLAWLDASVNGRPVREHWDDLATEHGRSDSPSYGKPVTISVHHPEHLDAALEVAQEPRVFFSKNAMEQYTPKFAALGSAIKRGQAPAPPGIGPSPQSPPPVMSNHYSRTTSMEPYLPWAHQADVKRYPGDGGAPVSLTNEEWASDKRQKYYDRQTGGHRLNWQPGQAGRGILIGSSLHTWPVEKTMDDPQGGLMHGEYVKKLGVNPVNVAMTNGFEINPDGTIAAGIAPPEAFHIEPNLRNIEEDWGSAFAKTAFLPLAPLVGMGGRLLLGQAVGGLMRKAIHGAGNFLDTAPQPDEFAQRPVGLVASERTAIGIDAPVETPHSQPDLIEDHDPEAVDQQEYNDKDMSPDQQNPNLDVGDGGLSQGTGEDAMKQKLEFRHDGDAVSQAELLLPLILEFVNSEKSGLENPQLKALHEALDAEIPGYLDHADENDEAVQKLLDELSKPEGVHAHTKESIGVYNTTPMAPGQQQMGVGQQMPMPGTHQNPIQQGGMPVNGKCVNCGGVVNADGSCPQCGAAAGANQQGNLEGPGQMQAPLGIMPSPYAKVANWTGGHPNCGHNNTYIDELGNIKCGDCGATALDETDTRTLNDIHSLPVTDPRIHGASVTAADHQGPITPQQKQVFAEYLIEQGRDNEVAAMMANPGLYADEWAQYLNRSTQPPEIDPNDQPAPPVMDPNQMAQMPVPGMSIPQPTAAADGGTSPRRCPKCTSATTTVMNTDGDMRCHRCGNIWENDVVEDHLSKWVVKSLVDPIQPNQSPANPVAAPAADATAPGDREQQADSSLSWQSVDGTPLQVGQTYEMHSQMSPIPDVVKIQAVKPDSITVTMEGEYNAPSDPQDQNGPDYAHEIDLNELQTAGLTFNPLQQEGDEQSQDQGEADGIGQTINTEPTRQSPEVPNTASAKTAATTCPYCGSHDLDPFEDGSGWACQNCHSNVFKNPAENPDQPKRFEGSFQRFAPMSEYDQYFGGESGAAAKAKAAMIKQYGEKKGEEVFYATVNKKKSSEELPTDHCPECDYGHVTSNYNSPTEIQYECFRCAHRWKVAEDSEDGVGNEDSRSWLNEDDGPGSFNFDRVVGIESAKGGKGRNIRDIAANDPRNQEIHNRLEANRANRTAGAKFSPREQKEFIDEDGVARNSDRLSLDGTHYVESAFDLSKANPDKVDENYIGLGL